MTIARRSAAALVAALALVASSQFVRAEGDKVRVDGIGAAQCSEITAGFQTQASPVANQLVGWAFGYMTRRNVERGLAGQSQVNFSSAGVTQEKLVTIILGYCEKDPSTRIYQIVDALYEVLLEKGSLTS